MKYYEDLSEYRDQIEPSLWRASGPPAVRPEELYIWLWSPHGQPEPTFGAPEKNIGWLDSRHEYPRGPSGEEFKAVLEKMCNETRYHLWRARRDCPICKRELAGPLAAEIRVRGLDVVYAAPNVVSHHIAVHNYAPPQEFVEAVLESKGRQAEPVLGTTRSIPPDLLVREHVDAGALLQRVVDLVRSEGKADQIRDVSIVFDGSVFVVDATFAPQRVPEASRRTWNVPENAVLNIDQGSFGIRSMLSCQLQKRYDEIFRKGKPPIYKE
ncbi:MAG: hypothetical protein ACMG6S_04160 [Byssovorax sp.]